MNEVLKNIFANFYKLGLFSVMFFFAGITFFAKESIDPIYQSIYHYGFLAISIGLFFALLIFNQVKPLFFIITLFSSYLVLNHLRNAMLLESELYHNWGVFMLSALCLSVLIPSNKVLKKKNLVYLLLFLSGIMAIEHLSKAGIFIPYNTYLLAVMGGLFLFFYSGIKNQVLQYAYFFAFLSAMLGYFFAFNTSAFTMFLGIAILIIALGVAFDLYFNTWYNSVSLTKNKRAFLKYAQEKGTKLAIAIVCIDEIKTLEEQFGKQNLKKLIFMVADIIKEKHIKVFHIKRDDFVIVFENLDSDEGFEEIEAIRRQIATTDFVLKGYEKPIKLTISASVVDKKRSDADIFAAFVRAQKDLLKRKNFNNNFTSKG